MYIFTNETAIMYAFTNLLTYTLARSKGEERDKELTRASTNTLHICESSTEPFSFPLVHMIQSRTSEQLNQSPKNQKTKKKKGEKEKQVKTCPPTSKPHRLSPAGSHTSPDPAGMSSSQSQHNYLPLFLYPAKLVGRTKLHIFSYVSQNLSLSLSLFISYHSGALIPTAARVRRSSDRHTHSPSTRRVWMDGAQGKLA